MQSDAVLASLTVNFEHAVICIVDFEHKIAG